MTLKTIQDFYKANRGDWNNLPPEMKDYEMKGIEMLHSAILPIESDIHDKKKN